MYIYQHIFITKYFLPSDFMKAIYRKPTVVVSHIFSRIVLPVGKFRVRNKRV